MAKTAPAKNHRHPGKPVTASAPTPKNGGKAAPKVAKADPKPAAKPESKVAKTPEVKGKSKAQLDLEAKIVHLIAESMALEEAELTPHSSLKEDLNLDAIDVAELLMQAEETFNLNPFHEGDWESCETVDDFTKLITKRVDAKRAKKNAGKD